MRANDRLLAGGLTLALVATLCAAGVLYMLGRSQSGAGKGSGTKESEIIKGRERDPSFP